MRSRESNNQRGSLDLGVHSLHLSSKTQDSWQLDPLNPFLPHLFYKTDYVSPSKHVESEITILGGSKSTKKDRQWDLLWCDMINSVRSQKKIASSYACHNL